MERGLHYQSSQFRSSFLTKRRTKSTWSLPPSPLLRPPSLLPLPLPLFPLPLFPLPDRVIGCSQLSWLWNQWDKLRSHLFSTDEGVGEGGRYVGGAVRRQSFGAPAKTIGRSCAALKRQLYALPRRSRTNSHLSRTDWFRGDGKRATDFYDATTTEVDDAARRASSDFNRISVSFLGNTRRTSPWVRSKTPPEGYSVFVSYESSMCKTAIEHPRVPF